MAALVSWKYITAKQNKDVMTARYVLKCPSKEEARLYAIWFT
jgi:hypothetical protein